MRRPDQRTDIVFLGDLPRRDGERAKPEAVFFESPGPPIGAPLSQKLIPRFVHDANLTLECDENHGGGMTWQGRGLRGERKRLAQITGEKY